MIDVDRLVGAHLPETNFDWDEKDVILYNLCVGAGVPPDDPAELRYAYEGDLVPIPTFATIPPFEMMMAIGSLPGLDLDLTRLLHGDQKVSITGEIPTRGSVTQTGRVTDVYDRGRGALIVVEVESRTDSGDLLFTNTSGLYLRGAGRFGGDRGPGRTPVPDREPDRVVRSSTLPQQALFYRLASGDHNPLHADPAFAALAGFDRPILHGLCTYGIVAKAVVDSVLEGRPSEMRSIRARFSGHVFPGETIVTSIWQEGDEFAVSAQVEERATEVIADGWVAV